MYYDPRFGLYSGLGFLLINLTRVLTMRKKLPLDTNNTSYIVISNYCCIAKILYNDDIINVSFNLADIDDFLQKELLRIIQYYKSNTKHSLNFKITEGEVIDTINESILPKTRIYEKLSGMLVNKSVDLKIGSKDYRISFRMSDEILSYSPINSLRYNQLLLRINDTNEYLVID